MDYVKLAKRLKTHPANAERCWAAWQTSRASAHPVPERGLSAFQNRALHFHRETGLGLGKSIAWARLLSEIEHDGLDD